jgi:hypothetical protein
MSSGTKRPPPTDGATTANVRARTVADDVVISGADVRKGIVSPAVYPALFFNNFKTWAVEYNACILGRGVSDECTDESTFNVLPPEKNPEIEWSDVSGDVKDNVIGEVAPGAVLNLAFLPYLKHPAMKLRPTLMMFSVTGHVMAAIYFARARGGVLHILNPWPIGAIQQIKDVYTILEERLGPAARHVIVVDIAEQVQKYASTLVGKIPINLQEGEAIGFCTLWVGILSQAVLTTETPKGTQPMTFLNEEVGKENTPGYQLSPEALKFYLRVYWRLVQSKDALVKQVKAEFGDDKCSAAAAAKAAVALAKVAAMKPLKGGKRTNGRRTRKGVSTWKRRDQRSSQARRTRRSTKKPGRRT